MVVDSCFIRRPAYDLQPAASGNLFQPSAKGSVAASLEGVETYEYAQAGVLDDVFDFVTLYPPGTHPTPHDFGVFRSKVFPSSRLIVAKATYQRCGCIVGASHGLLAGWGSCNQTTILSIDPRPLRSKRVFVSVERPNQAAFYPSWIFSELFQRIETFHSVSPLAVHLYQ